MKKGFSLVELLVVIAIIGIVLAIGTVSYITAQKQVRDAKRTADLFEIRQALETYRSENGVYPDDTTWSTDLAPAYMTTVPTDPLSSSYGYLAGASPITTYSLCATLEIAPTTPALTNCTSPFNYELTNP